MDEMDGYQSVLYFTHVGEMWQRNKIIICCCVFVCYSANDWHYLLKYIGRQNFVLVPYMALTRYTGGRRYDDKTCIWRQKSLSLLLLFLSYSLFAGLNWIFDDIFFLLIYQRNLSPLPFPFFRLAKSINYLHTHARERERERDREGKVRYGCDPPKNFLPTDLDFRL